MCSISVEPMPSRISTPSASVQRRPMSAGSASPADMQTRSVRSPSRREIRAREHRRDTASARRRRSSACCSFSRLNTAAGVGRSAISTRGRADRQRERERVAQAVGEEQLRRGEHDVVLADAEHRLARRARRSGSGSSARAPCPWARRSSPTSRARSSVVARRRRGVERVPASPAASCRCRCAVRISPGDDDVLEEMAVLPRSGAKLGSSASETTSARARLSREHDTRSRPS